MTDPMTEDIKKMLTKTWMASTTLRCRNELGDKYTDVTIPGQQFLIVPSDKTISEIVAYTTNKIRDARLEAKAEELHYLTTANIYTVLMLHPDLLDKLKKREASYKEKLALNHRKDD